MTVKSGRSRFGRLLVSWVAAAVMAAGATAATAADSVPAPQSVPAAAASTTTAAPVAASGADDTSDYTLGVADQVRVTVYNEPNLTGQFPVNANGTISMPLIGEIKASGLTSDQLREAIRTKLADGYLNQPRVAIDVLTFRPYYILGEITKAGEYPYSSNLTVLNAVATAQGFTYRANKKYVFIKHAGETAEDRVRLTDGLKVAPGDTLRIGERFF